MTNNTIPNVPRELLERAVRIPTKASVEENHAAIVDRGRAQSELRALLSAPSPAGVDGLSVVAVVNSDDGTTAGYGHLLQAAPDGEELCRLSDATAIIDGLRGELEAAGEILAQQGRRNTELRKMRDHQATRVAVLEAFMRCIQRMPVDDEFAERIIELIDSAMASPATDAWISVSERLPGEDDQVLCWCEDETVAWAEVSSHHNSFFTDMTHELLPVTHWMPLPAAPAARRDQGVPSAKS